ncbi:dipeptide epimerase [candidate division KSB1 bacterium]|nr:dipeptide epimerase [candidate division KSB1 bacterium]
MKLIYEPLKLRTRETFRITHGATQVANNVLVRITQEDGLEGIGEAAPRWYYDESQRSVISFLKKLGGELSQDPFDLEVVSSFLNGLSAAGSSAKAAVDVALHDLIGKILGLPLYKYLGLSPEKTPLTSFTIAMHAITKMEDLAREAGDFPVLKVKLGSGDDRDVIRRIRGVTDAVIRVDANEAWKTDEAIEKINQLAEFDIEFVEQPLPAGDLEGLKEVKANVDVPIFADESCKVPADIPKVAEAVDGVNIKVAKCGGLREALKMIHTARACGLKVMIGCMIESSVGITAAAHLSPLADYADLDGNLLISNDPFEGVRVEKGKLILPQGPGIGVVKRIHAVKM